MKLQYKEAQQNYKDLFFPSGYPYTTTDDYWQYQKWDCVQALASTINGLICTQAMLKSVGVGDAEATSLSALITWVLQDGCAMVSKIGFSYKYARHLDNECKAWRLAADYLNDFGMLLHVLAPILFMDQHNILVGMLCLGTCSKALCGVTGQATRTSLTLHFSKDNNMADVAAKDASQETVLNLVGMICGTLLLGWIDGQELLIFLTFALLVIVHLYANYMAVSNVVLDTLNEQRLQILLNRYMLDGHVCSPEEVAQQESIFWWYFTSWIKPYRVLLGVQLDTITDNDLHSENVYVVKQAEDHLFEIALHEDADALDVIDCYAQTYLRYCQHKQDGQLKEKIKQKWKVDHLNLSESTSFKARFSYSMKKFQ